MAVQQTSRSRTKKRSLARPTKEGHAGKGPTKMSNRARVRPDVVDSRRINVQNRIRSTFTGTRTLDQSMHKINIWLKELMTVMDWDNRERALSALRATLHGLRDILPLHEIIHLGAQMPLIVRGLFYENWHYHPEPLRLSSISEFYELVREKLGRGATGYTTEELRKFTRASLAILAHHISAGELYDIKGVLRRNLKGLIDNAQIDEAHLVTTEELHPIEPPPPRRGRMRPPRKTPRRARRDLQKAKEARREKMIVDTVIEQSPIH